MAGEQCAAGASLVWQNCCTLLRGSCGPPRCCGATAPGMGLALHVWTEVADPVAISGVMHCGWLCWEVSAAGHLAPLRWGAWGGMASTHTLLRSTGLLGPVAYPLPAAQGQALMSRADVPATSASLVAAGKGALGACWALASWSRGFWPGRTSAAHRTPAVPHLTSSPSALDSLSMQLGG